MQVLIHSTLSLPLLRNFRRFRVRSFFLLQLTILYAVCLFPWQECHSASPSRLPGVTGEFSYYQSVKFLELEHSAVDSGSLSRYANTNANANANIGGVTNITPDTSADTLGGYSAWTTAKTGQSPSQSPTSALLKSMFVPGLGQIGNGKYLKAALVISTETLLILRWRHFRNETVATRDALENTPISDLTTRASLFSRFQIVRNDRNLFAWLAGTAIFLSMFDAFVDAHLASFPGSELELSAGPLPATNLWTLSPTLSQPLIDDLPVQPLGLTLNLRF